MKNSGKILFVTSNKKVADHIMQHFSFETKAYPKEDSFVYLKKLNLNETNVLNFSEVQNEIYLLNTGLGQTEAAITLTTCLCYLKFDLVVSVGMAGALIPDLKIGDILVANSIVQHDFKIRRNGDETLLPLNKLPSVPCDIEESSQKNLTPVLLEQTLDLLKNINNSPVKLGTLLSGNEFISGQNRAKELRTLHENAVAIDMEAAAICMTSQKFKTPYVVVKIIADNLSADWSGATDQFHQYEQSIASYSLPLFKQLQNLDTRQNHFNQ